MTKYFKRITAVGMAMALCLSCVGCGSSDVTLTDEQNDLIAEYVGGVLVKYSYQDEWKYTKLNTALNTYQSKNTTSKVGQSATSAAGTSTVVNASTAADSTDSQSSAGGSSSTGSTGTTGTSAKSAADVLSSLSTSLGFTGVSISLSDVVVGDTYPASSYSLTVPAESGKKIVAVEFTLTNTTGSSMALNTKGKSVTAKLSAGSGTYTTYSSMLKGDMLNLSSTTLDAGASYTAHLLYQVNTSDAASVNSGSVTFTAAGTQLGSISLK